MRTFVLVASLAVSFSLAGLTGSARACDAEKKGAMQLSAADAATPPPSKPAADAACGCGMGGGGKCCSAGAAEGASQAPAASTAPAPEAGRPAGCSCGKKKPGAS